MHLFLHFLIDSNSPEPTRAVLNTLIKSQILVCQIVMEIMQAASCSRAPMQAASYMLG